MIIGHEAAMRDIIVLWRSGRAPHAWLFHGPDGIGKALLAYNFATFVLAGGQGESLQVSPDNPTARRMDAGGHADFIRISRGLNERGVLREEIVVDDVRKIEPLFHHTAAEGGWRVVLVDGADRINMNAQNAILKILEEPPPRALILLTAEQPGRLLPTLRSRVHRMALASLTEAQVVAVLRTALPALEANEFAELAALSNGSPGWAIELQRTEGHLACREFVALTGEADTRAMLDFAERHGRKGAEGGFQVLARYIPEYLSEVVRAAAGLVTVESARVLAMRLGLNRALALHERVKAMILETNGLHLDTKQTLLGILFAIHEP